MEDTQSKNDRHYARHPKLSFEKPNGKTQFNWICPQLMNTLAHATNTFDIDTH